MADSLYLTLEYRRQITRALMERLSPQEAALIRHEEIERQKTTIRARRQDCERRIGRLAERAILEPEKHDKLAREMVQEQFRLKLLEDHAAGLISAETILRLNPSTFDLAPDPEPLAVGSVADASLAAGRAIASRSIEKARAEQAERMRRRRINQERALDNVASSLDGASISFADFDEELAEAR